MDFGRDGQGSTALLWDDGRVVAIDKPPGVSLATPRREPGAAVARLLGALPPDVRQGHGLEPDGLFLVHRLDVGTSGLVLLARDEDAHRTCSRLLAEGRLKRVYLTLCWGRPSPAEGRFDLSLGPDRRDRRRMRPDPDGRPARTRYRVLARAPHVSLAVLFPETGRTHQIRVHLAAAGHPVVGDDLYGGPRHRGVRDSRLRAALDPGHTLLHAWRLHLPTTRCFDETILEAPPPATFRAACTAAGIALEDTIHTPERS
ncbi:MAG: RNA pseudouridine synthase [Acidobacteria bacterium]|nr:RNA pseudouridine synthase [Acidobacteriota bacterium]